MNLLDWIYPPQCFICRNALPLNRLEALKRFRCEACEGLLTPIEPPVCEGCGCPLEEQSSRLCASCQGRARPIDRNIAVYTYEDLIKELIHEMKYRSRKTIAMGLGVSMAEACSEKGITGYDWLVPVPMYPAKRRKRGFNQAEVMAREISRRIHVPVAADMLIRIRDTKPQSGLSRAGRNSNLAGAFRFNPRFDISHKKICLVDDIYTTGATIFACAKALNGEPAVISCITLSVAVKNNEKV